MTGRIRARIIGANTTGSEYVSVFGGPFSLSQAPLYYARSQEYMEDATDPQPWPDHPLNHTFVSRPLVMTMTGEYAWWIFKWRYNNRAVDNVVLSAIGAPTGNRSAGYLVTQALANVNPSNPLVDVPLFLFEFKDFPGMLKNAGDILSGIRNISKGINPKHANDGFLAYQFGWAPLFSDLRKLLNFAKEFEKRQNFLKQNGGGKKIRRNLGGDSMTGPVFDRAIGFPAGETLTWTLQETTKWTYWYTCFFKLGAPWEDHPKVSDLQLARAMLGLNLSASTIWNALPWSFLIDYFANIGTYLNAIRGYLPFTATRMCVMSKGKVTQIMTAKNDQVQTVKLSPIGVGYSQVKSRQVYLAPTPVLAFSPALSDKQIANMSSLALARFLK